MLSPILLVIVLLYSLLVVALAVGVCITFGEKGKSNGKVKSVSVIVPFRNEAENLVRLISVVNSQTLSPDLWEVILVDDGSVDNYSDSIETLIQGRNYKLLKLPLERHGKKQALLLGVSHAKNSLIVFTDADCIPASPRWLERLSERSVDAAFLQGLVKVQFLGSIWEWADALEYASLMAVSAGSFGIGRPVIAASANLGISTSGVAINESTIKADVPSGDDMFLLHEAKREKVKTSFVGAIDASVLTRGSTSFSHFFKRRQRWASKSVHYTDFDTIFVGLLTLLANLAIIVLLLLAVFGNVSWSRLFLVWTIKACADFLLLSAFLLFSKQFKLMLLFIPLQLLYPFYVVITFIKSILGVNTWKGRSIS